MELLEQPDLAALVEAAHEAGLSKDSVALALRERLAERQNWYKPGDLVFSLSADGRWYPSVFLSIEGSRIHVRYLTGGESICEPHQIRPFVMTPGQVIDAYYAKMWCKSYVVRFNSDSRNVTVNIWGGEAVISLEHVRSRPEKRKLDSMLNVFRGKDSSRDNLRAKILLGFISVSVVAGILGFLVGLAAG